MRTIVTIAAVVLTVVCYLFVDEPLALALVTPGSPRASAIELPDLLLALVIIVTAAGWTGRFVLRGRPGWEPMRRCLASLGEVAPAAYLAKSVLKIVCGRPTTRTWIEDPQPDVFHWFQGFGAFGGFPSGHMLVIVALGAVMWRHYPQWRAVWGGSLVLLALALVGTKYHFLSDVIAGGYVGLALAWALVGRYSGAVERT